MTERKIVVPKDWSTNAASTSHDLGRTSYSRPINNYTGTANLQPSPIGVLSNPEVDLGALKMKKMVGMSDQPGNFRLIISVRMSFFFLLLYFLAGEWTFL